MSFNDIDDLNIDYETKIFQQLNEFTEDEVRHIKKNDLSIIHINIRNLTRNSFLKLHIHLEKIMEKIDIIVLTETKCKREEMILYEIDNFNMTYYCREKGQGGGIVIYTKKYINTTENKNTTFKHAENLIIEIHKINMIIHAIYRPPKLNKKEFLKELKDWLKTVNNKDIILIGDININTLDNNNDNHKNSYMEILSSNGILNTITAITREEIRDNRLTKSCIDHINIKTRSKITSAIIQEKIADHYYIFAKLDNIFEYNNKNKNELVEITIIDDSKINQLISEYNWEELMKNYDSIENLYNKFVQTFHNLYDLSKKKITLKRKYIGNTWITKEIRESIKRKNDMWKNLKKNPGNTSLMNEYKKFKNKITNQITQAKRKENQNKFNRLKGDMKKTWNEIDKIRNKQKRNTEEVIMNNFKKSNKTIEDICEEFNKRFIEDIVELKNTKQNMQTTMNFESHTNNQNNEQFKIQKIDSFKLDKIVKNININKGPGYDGIRPKDIKVNITYLENIIKYIINKIIEENEIPNQLKISVITPVFKKGNKEDFSNYRPIAILSCIEKILEKHIQLQLSSFIENNKFLNDFQHGFRRERSTTTLLNIYSEDLNKALNENKYCVTLSLDLKRAYDTIDHQNMMKILINMGLEENTKNLISNFFENRKQLVKIGKQHSNTLDIKNGLIQGAILSPTLFNIYVKDLNNINLQSKILQYADDTLLYYITDDLDDGYKIIQNDFNKIIIWLNKKDIYLNKEKTINILFENPMITRFRRNNENNIKVHKTECIDNNSTNNCNCTIIKEEKSMKYLGIQFHRNLKWNLHVQYLRKKLNFIAYQMHYIENIIPLSIKAMLYKTLCESIIRYGIETYGKTTEESIKPLLSIQKRILKSTLYPHTTRIQREIMMKKYRILNFKNLHQLIIITKYYYEQEFRKIWRTQYNI